MGEGSNRRRHQRYAFNATADLVRGKRVQQLYTHDVSFSGLFLRTDDPPPLRELVKIRFELPSDGQPIDLLGMAVHRVPPGGPRQSGIGILLYGLDPKVRGRWERFVQEVRAGRYGKGPTDDLPLEPQPEATKDYRPELRVQVPNAAALEILRDRDLARACTFVSTEVYFEPGTPVIIIFVHPESGRAFEMSAHVKKQIVRPGLRGLALDLDGVDQALRDAFDAFVVDDVHVTVDVVIDPSVDVLGDE